MAVDLFRLAAGGAALLGAGLMLLAGAPTEAQGPAGGAAAAPHIPRKTKFGNTDPAGAQISPDGKRISFQAPLEGVLNLWVAPADNLEAAKALTKDKGRGIQTYFWAYNGRHLIYLQDKDGEENDHVYRVDAESGEVTDLTPLTGVKAQIHGLSPRHPDAILVGLNQRNPQLHDTYRVDLKTGERTLVKENPGFVAMVADDDLKVRLGVAFTPDFKMQLVKFTGDGKTETFATIPSEDLMTTNPAGFNKAGDALYMLDSRGRDKSALKQINLANGKERLLAEDGRADLGAPLLHPTEKKVLAVPVDYERTRWKVLDPSLKQDFARLEKVSEGDFTIASQTLDNQSWIVSYTRDNGPVAYYRYDRPKKKATFLFHSRKALEGLKLARMRPVIIPARDGLELVCYLSMPPGSDSNGDGRPEKPLPTVLDVHGGPWGRDSWGYNPFHQWMANRGYAVLSINFRGSTGFGKKFINAANREWAGKMHDDLLDAVDWAVKRKIADPQKVGIWGGSYGGYAVLVGLTFTPERFACGVDLFGPSSLITLMENVPPYWVPLMPILKDRVGDHTTEEGRKLLHERSPLHRVDRIRRPLLIGQGANDPRVKQVESDQIVRAMKEKGIPVTYVLYPDEGHGFARPENRLSFFAVMEQFLAQHLGGRAEPVGDAFQGSSVQVKEGGPQVPGLQLR